jgi:hypothetical protein
MSRAVPCPWPDFCQCTHQGACVAGWLDHEETDVATPCANCRPDLFREMNLRHHARGDNTVWLRAMDRPLTKQWTRS